MIERGDLFIHYTKYGGVNKGEVGNVGYTSVVDTTNNIVYRKVFITTTTGVRLALDGSDGQIYKIERELTPEDSIALDNLCKNMPKRKAEISFVLKEQLKNKKFKNPENE